MSSERSRDVESALRADVVRVCHLMYRRGLIAATDGNVSARLADDLLVTTPSGVPKGFVAVDDLVVTDLEGQPPFDRAPHARGYRPSSELRLHLEVYRQRPDVGAVVHAHPPITTALTVADVSLAPCVVPETLTNLGTIVTTSYATPSSAQGPVVIRDLIGRHDALVLDRHGAITVGIDALDAYAKMEKVEHTAIVLATARQLGQVRILPMDEIARLVAMRARHLGIPLARAAPDCARCAACPGYQPPE